jgi:putative radical SAM enzyme (TIGR03279 family)
MAQKGVLVIAVEPESLAYDGGIRAGDTLLEINGEPVLDQLSYQFLIAQRDLTEVAFLRPGGDRASATLENGGDGIGVDLAQDEVKVCKQNCVFCFVLQMPKGFRKSLYLKDEDIRLSFRYGHFSTLSSSDDAELDRMVRERLSPIHVSVHATDPVVRVKVVGNPREGDILRKIDRLLLGGVDIHTQVVLVPGLNDGEIWAKTVRELWERRAFQTEGPWAGNCQSVLGIPGGDTKKGGVLSLSCVPVGLTRHRDGLPQIPDIDPGFARAWAEHWIPEVRRCTRENGGEPWLLLADEWFTRGQLEVPGRGFYSHSWAQLENGVGLVRKFLEHSRRFLHKPKAKGFSGRRVLLLTGASFAPVLNRTLAQLNRASGGQLRAVAVRNSTFGETVTVAGLLCGQDLAYAAHADRQAHGGAPRWVDAVVVPSASLRVHVGPTDQYVLPDHAQATPATQFLDDMTLAALGVQVIPGGENLSQLLDHLQASDSFHTTGMNLPQGAYNP